MPIAAAVAAVGSIGGAIISSNAAGDAADAQVASGNKALKQRQKMFDVAQSNLEPYMNIGKSVLPTLSDLVSGGFNAESAMTNLQKYPGYQFALGEGRKQLDADLSKMGSRVSGNAIKGGIEFGQNAATTLFDNYWAKLAHLAGIGQAGASASAGNAMQFGDQQANTEIGIGNARAGGIVGQGNVWSGLVSNTLPAIAGGANLGNVGDLFSATGGGGGGSSGYNNTIFNPGSPGKGG